MKVSWLVHMVIRTSELILLAVMASLVSPSVRLENGAIGEFVSAVSLREFYFHWFYLFFSPASSPHMITKELG